MFVWNWDSSYLLCFMRFRFEISSNFAIWLRMGTAPITHLLIEFWWKAASLYLITYSAATWLIKMYLIYFRCAGVYCWTQRGNQFSTIVFRAYLDQKIVRITSVCVVNICVDYRPSHAIHWPNCVEHVNELNHNNNNPTFSKLTKLPAMYVTPIRTRQLPKSLVIAIHCHLMLSFCDNYFSHSCQIGLLVSKE